MRQMGILLVNRCEPPPLEGRVLCMLNGILNAALAVGISGPGGVGNDFIVLEHPLIHRVERWLVNVRLEPALLEAIEDHAPPRLEPPKYRQAPSCSFAQSS